MTRTGKAGGRCKAPPADPLIEALAEIEHEQWCLWAEHMLANATAVNLRRWRRQIATPYAQLSEADKEKDRVFARKVLQALVQHLKMRAARASRSRELRA